MNESVSIAAIALAATTVAALVWVVKYFAKTLSTDLQEHTKAAYKQVEASNKQISAAKEQKAASNEVLIFMQNLNGKLTKATISTAASNIQIRNSLVSSAKIASDASRDGGMLVKTKETNPLDVKPIKE